MQFDHLMKPAPPSAAINAGIQLDYGDNVFNDITNAIAAGKMTQKSLDDAVARTFLTRFRLGEFDEERNPSLARLPKDVCFAARTRRIRNVRRQIHKHIVRTQFGT